MFRASSIGKLMASPDKAILPVGAITELDKLISQKLLNWHDDFDFNTLEKGRVCEDASIDLYNELHDEFYIKNVERITKNISTGLIVDSDSGLIFDASQPVSLASLTGECDIIDRSKSLVIDIKTAYSKKTYPVNLKLSSLYEWQLRAYMYLYDVNNAELAYCLVDTPHELINHRDMIEWHTMDNVPLHLRVRTLRIERDATKEQYMLNRIALAHKYVTEQIECLSKRA